MSHVDLFTGASQAPEMAMTAVLSKDEGQLYRPELRRVWDRSKPLLVVCMLNPSTADHRRNDPTVLTLIHFARLWGYGGLLIVNLFDFRAASPKDMMAAAQPISPENVSYIDGALNEARHRGTPVLAAWGRGGDYMGRDVWFIERARKHFVNLVCLGLTKEGFPKHPMARGTHRIPRDQQPISFRKALVA
ncbi:DUF1643 domain-containing protein [Rhizobium lentis]|uniref:DUF1643 domain-containing protein n=1 Tax=Rhizobium lentis TaxID=1138194 RepID=UPI001C838F46|nr:DUF1643 domain-containing protein [Rhizobium lentis]MBX5082132.1 DUF1643 domain-containing protein [Rhizobium lentis]MBX5094842.1 DUF1643 domain-containing protein [Rhizobium lentis]MBX5119567.1 DUF1643 domain-containing protein [Rhizobium lentis]